MVRIGFHTNQNGHVYRQLLFQGEWKGGNDCRQICNHTSPIWYTRQISSSDRNTTFSCDLSKNKTWTKNPLEATGIKGVYTNDSFKGEKWQRNNIVGSSATAVGFDIEWKLQFVGKKHGGTENETAVLQLGVEGSCLVLHIYYISEMQRSLKLILRGENILKVGIGIDLNTPRSSREKTATSFPRTLILPPP